MEQTPTGGVSTGVAGVAVETVASATPDAGAASVVCTAAGSAGATDAVSGVDVPAVLQAESAQANASIAAARVSVFTIMD
jgi:hypothetical protein